MLQENLDSRGLAQELSTLEVLDQLPLKFRNDRSRRLNALLADALEGAAEVTKKDDPTAPWFGAGFTFSLGRPLIEAAAHLGHRGDNPVDFAGFLAGPRELGVEVGRDLLGFTLGTVAAGGITVAAAGAYHALGRSGAVQSEDSGFRSEPLGRTFLRAASRTLACAGVMYFNMAPVVGPETALPGAAVIGGLGAIYPVARRPDFLGRALSFVNDNLPLPLHPGKWLGALPAKALDRASGRFAEGALPTRKELALNLQRQQQNR